MMTLGGLQINTIPVRKNGTPAMNHPQFVHKEPAILTIF